MHFEVYFKKPCMWNHNINIYRDHFKIRKGYGGDYAALGKLQI